MLGLSGRFFYPVHIGGDAGGQNNHLGSRKGLTHQANLAPCHALGLQVAQQGCTLTYLGEEEEKNEARMAYHKVVG